MTKMTAKVVRTGHLFAFLLILMSMLTGLVTSGSSVVTAAANIRPTYQTDANGTYPTNSWQVTGQQNVINQRGGDQVLGWDNNTIWNGDATDTTNSYLKFGDPNNPDYQIRKYAKETNTPGLYDVYLNVKGNTQQNVKPVDIVLVVDMSGSMESNSRGTNRADAVRTGVKNFLTSIQNAGLGDYVNVGLIGFSSPGYIGGGNKTTGPGYIRVGLGKVGNTKQQQAINDALSPMFQGGTYTQIGLRQGSAMLNADTSGNKKMMILLTDGVPTFSNKVINSEWINGTLYGTNFGSSRDKPGDTARLRWPYSDKSGHRIYDTWPATLGEAKIAKDSGNEVHALGIQLADDRYYADDGYYMTYMTKEKIRKNMQLITNSPDLYEDADSADAVEAYLKNQAKDIIKKFNTVADGTITDPIGTQFQYANNQATVTSVGKQTVPASELPSAAIQDGQLTVNHMNLGRDQEVQIHYQERINTESNNFVPDKWYQMNGATTLTPNGDDPSNKVDFGIPSAKAPGTKLTINKVWNMLPNDNKIPDSIDFTVNRGNTTDNNAWTQATGSLSKTQNWTGTFDKLSHNNSNVYLPKFNNHGQDFTYNLSEDNVAGFSSSINQVLNNFTITNNELGLAVQKFDSGGNILTGSQFTLVKDTDNWQATDSSFTPESINGNDNPIPIKPGYYELKESTAPVGYSLDASTIKFQVTENGQWLDQQGTPIRNNTLPSSDGFYVNNQNGNDILTYAKHDNIKPFTLTVNKIDKVTNQSVKGAEFQLTNSDTNQTIQPDESGDTATFTFNNLQPGNYVLSETKAPTDYAPLSSGINFSIDNTGKVTIPDGYDSNSELTAGNSNNTISLTVPDTPTSGQLPATGGPGITIILVTGLIIMITTAAGIIFISRRRWEV
ncbi:SpaA isopeptide-forming pilin-related protein [Lactobacillus delbrueckii subsp. allosunkii]|uniref:SpaA isopeptide-forming pilin-related protein n=2 Tax=Lactobacillus delbrueckii TaxID=1584 RepID=UPI0001DC979E|nr:SpaA isopeptide-forming pilin-related protein [Lactobacillus delbrueckii]EFK31350.1 von Willebrand factor type A domain protein [Lactobacillus delbrueckii subsp. bulgaricus PB2003/044-T3-4]